MGQGRGCGRLTSDKDNRAVPHRYFSKDVFRKLTEDNRELLIIPDAVHTDLYDGGGEDAISFDKPAEFFAEHLK